METEAFSCDCQPQKAAFDLRAEALRYFEQGFNVVAMFYEYDGNGNVARKGALVEWGKWHTQRQTMEEFESQPWDKAEAFGIVCSFPNKEGLFLTVVDYDVKKVSGEAKARGKELLKRLPITQMEETVSGGIHYIYLSRVKPSRSISEFHDSHALELVATGKLCVMAPSKGYKRLNDNPPRIIEDAEGLFYEVLGVEDDRAEASEGLNNKLLHKWLEQLKPHLKIRGEGSQYIYILCPFHEEERPSFAINKVKFYAVDYHDGKVYSLKALANALGVTLEGASTSSLSLNGFRIEVQGKDCFIYDRQGVLLDSFKAHLLNSKAVKAKLAEITGLSESEANAKIASFLLKLKNGEEKDALKDEGEPEPVFDLDWLVIHPALDTINGKAYVGVELPCKVKLEDGTEEIRDFHFLITSEREKILCLRENLNKEKIKLAHTVVRMPNRWSLQSVKAWLEGKATVEPQEVYTAVKTIFEKYMEFDEPILYDFASLWTIGTYFFHLFPAYPYLYIGGMKRVGKTKMLQIMKELCFNAILSGDMSTASLFRLVQSGRCTVLLDETEELSNPETKESIRRLLLNGYKRAGVVFRTDKDSGVPEAYEVYSPKAIANIKGLEDVLEDRTITIILKRGKNPQIINSEIRPEQPFWQQTRDMLYLFYMERFSELGELNECSELGGEDGLNERERELWKPILALAKYFNQRFNGLYDRIKEFAKRKVKEKLVENMTETGDYLLVQTLLETVQTEAYYKVKEVKEALASKFDEPQKWLTTKWVGNALKRLGFKEKRRVGTGYEYKLSPEAVRDLAERLNISTDMEDDREADSRSLQFSHPSTQSSLSSLHSPSSLTKENFEAVWNALVEASKVRGSAHISEVARLSGLPSETVQLILKQLEREGRAFQIYAEWWKPVA